MLGKQADLFAILVAWWEHTPRGFYQPLRDSKMQVWENVNHTVKNFVLWWQYIWLQSDNEIETHFCNLTRNTKNTFIHAGGVQLEVVFTHWCTGSRGNRCLSGSSRFDRSKCWTLLSWHGCWLDRAGRGLLPVWTWRCQDCKLMANERKNGEWKVRITTVEAIEALNITI